MLCLTFELITGRVLEFLYLLLWLFLAAELAFTGWKGLSLAGRIASIWKRQRAMKSAGRPMEQPAALHGESAGERITRASRAALLVLFSFAAGSVWTSWQQDRGRYHYEDVLVRQRIDAQNFIVQPVRMQPWHLAACAPLDWQEAEKARWISLKRQTDCLDAGAGGAYKFYEDDRGKRIKFYQEIAAK